MTSLEEKQGSYRTVTNLEDSKSNKKRRQQAHVDPSPTEEYENWNLPHGSD